ncbi:SURF1 family protein [Povalibacter sp.]|uniref:SURF1 family protein n=1 Tax=Povalibacter sp. TaxID=1962978 RepID=UPI002F404173
MGDYNVGMLFADRRFAPSIFATILLMLGLAAFVRLGLWQLDRAEEKQSLIDRYDTGGQTTLDLTAAAIDSIPLYQHIRARGRYEPARQILLDNMPSEQGRPGYRVVTPFALDEGGILLVDRGWVPMGPTRTDLPAVDVATQPRELMGRFDTLPRAGITLDIPHADPLSNWPRVMNYPQQGDIESALGRSVLPGLVLLDADQPDGFERAWHTRFQSGPQRHLAYAVQWFGLALAAIVIYLVVSFRRKHIR